MQPLHCGVGQCNTVPFSKKRIYVTEKMKYKGILAGVLPVLKQGNLSIAYEM